METGFVNRQRIPARIGRLVLWAYCGCVLMFLLAPLLVVVPMSFAPTRYLEFPPSAISSRWYANFFQSSDWLHALGRSSLVATLSAALATALGTGAAYVIARTRFPGRTAVSLVIVSPLVVAIIILALGVYFVFARLRLLETMTGLVLAHTVLTLPVVFLTVSSALAHVDKRFEDAASGLGAGRLYVFRRVTLPMIRPGVVAGALLSFITSFDEPVVAIFVAGTRAVTLPKKMWDGIRLEVDPTVAAVSTMLLALGLFAAVIAFLFLRRGARDGQK